MAQNQTKYSFIAEEIRKRIMNHAYPLNQPIPDEITLAKEFDCSRMTMKKRLKYLYLKAYYTGNVDMVLSLSNRRWTRTACRFITKR